MEKRESLPAACIDCLGVQKGIRVIIRRRRGRHLGVDASLMVMITAVKGERVIMGGPVHEIVRIAHDGYLMNVTHLDLIEKRVSGAREGEPRVRSPRTSPWRAVPGAVGP